MPMIRIKNMLLVKQEIAIKGIEDESGIKATLPVKVGCITTICMYIYTNHIRDFCSFFD